MDTLSSTTASRADDNGMGMVDHDTATNPRCWMNVRTEDHGRPALQVVSEVLAARFEQPVCHAIGLQCLEALEVQQWLNVAITRRITVKHGQQVGARRNTDIRVGVQRIFKALHDQLSTDIRISEPLRQPVTQCFFKTRRIQNRREQEAAKARIRARVAASASCRIRSHTGSTLVSFALAIVDVGIWTTSGFTVQQHHSQAGVCTII